MNNDCNCNCSPNYNLNYQLWSTIPYPNRNNPYEGIDPSAMSWPLMYISRDCSNNFYDFKGDPISFKFIDPNFVDFNKELLEVMHVQNNLTCEQKNIATFWGTGVPAQQWTPIFLKLIDEYNVTPPTSARILACLQNVMNDAFVVTWHYKYYFDCARPCQLNRDLKTHLATPIFPTYPSGHSLISGAVEVVLSYFFPKEACTIHKLAESASISRLYGGIHFNSDLQEGLSIGRQLGACAVEYLKTEHESDYIIM
ncbi:vanadium-dependent haloperoxidase [uncultured Clostridium sp.]|uniref:vanadium-dependent haloperoxidase n=1 Tax=uncultured Clostridium sp. TaxID=59620 RepID=UPI00262CA376|nr:vanadium-dependent haloperoxidase [uncultured Clostridium sp.]